METFRNDHASAQEIRYRSPRSVKLNQEGVYELCTITGASPRVGGKLNVCPRTPNLT